MQIISVNIGQARPIEGGDPAKLTGIYKQPVTSPVRVTAQGLSGDAICSAKHHGGPDQAVYIYGRADYQYFEQQLGHPLQPGTFGENLTISEFASASFSAGDRLYVGDVVLQVTAPRIPCGIFAQRMGDPHFVQRFRQAGRPGLYCRVLRPGWLQVGNLLRVERTTSPSITMLEIFNNHYNLDLNEAELLRQLAAPIAARARRETEEKLNRLREEKS